MSGNGPSLRSAVAPETGLITLALPTAGYQMVVIRVRLDSCGAGPWAGVDRERSTNVVVITPTAYELGRGAAGFACPELEQPTTVIATNVNAVAVQQTRPFTLRPSTDYRPSQSPSRACLLLIGRPWCSAYLIQVAIQRNPSLKLRPDPSLILHDCLDLAGTW